MRGFVKDPEAILDYGVNWGPWLNGDEISSSSWTVESPLVIVPASDSKTTTTTRVFVSGGDLGAEYDLINTIVTTGSRTDERTLKIRVRDR